MDGLQMRPRMITQKANDEQNPHRVAYAMRIEKRE